MRRSERLLVLRCQEGYVHGEGAGAKSWTRGRRWRSGHQGPPLLVGGLGQGGGVEVAVQVDLLRAAVGVVDLGIVDDAHQLGGRAGHLVGARDEEGGDGLALQLVGEGGEDGGKREEDVWATIRMKER